MLKRDSNPLVLYEDAHLIVLDKPAGFLSQGGSAEGPNIVDWLRLRWGRPYVGLIHRLDRNTSGLMVVAARTKAANRLTAALQAGKIDRRYLAWVEGRITGPARWQHWLVKNEETNLVTAFSKPNGRPGEKEAVLSLTPKNQSRLGNQEISLIELKLETGRSHQIRAQAKHAGHILLGDRKYGSRIEQPGRPALHSSSLQFPHPMGERSMHFESPLPPDLQLG